MRPDHLTCAASRVTADDRLRTLGFVREAGIEVCSGMMSMHGEDYSTLEIERGPYVTNVMRGRMWGYKDDLAKVGKAVDRTEWGMTPQTVNASYNPVSYTHLTLPTSDLV